MPVSNSFQAGAVRRRESKYDADAPKTTESDQVVVLIRLPHLQSGACPVAEVPGRPEPTLTPPALTPPALTPPALPVPAAAAPAAAAECSTVSASEQLPREPDDDFPSLAERWVARLANLADESKRYVAGTRIPKPVWKMTVAAAIVALILMALMSLRGGDNGRMEVADKGLPGLEFPEVPIAGSSMYGEKSTDSAPVQNPMEASPAMSAKVIKKAPRAAESASEEIESAAPQLEPMTPSDKAEDDSDDEPIEPASEDVDRVLPLIDPKTDRATPPASERAEVEGVSTNPAQAIAERPAQDAWQPPTDSSPRWAQASAGQDPSPQNYLTTDPSTYRYPSRYELLFRGEPRASGEDGYPSSHNQSSIYGWQPSQARLQPRIEPPPIR